jgi:hypothetical protein
MNLLKKFLASSGVELHISKYSNYKPFMTYDKLRKNLTIYLSNNLLIKQKSCLVIKLSVNPIIFLSKTYVLFKN